MTPWTPSRLRKPFTQYDMSVDANLTLSSGKIAGVTDLGGLGRHAVQATDASRFTRLVGSLNGLNTASASLNTFLSLPSIPQVEGQDIFAVYKATSGATSYRVFMNRNGITAPGLYVGSFTADYRPAIYYQRDYVVGNSGTHSTWTMVQWRISSVAGKSIVRINDEATPAVNASPSYGLTEWTTLGMSSIQQFLGEIAEVVICDFATNDSERTHMFGYLGHKWGLTSLLASDHRFKTQKPVCRGTKTTVVIV